MRKGYFRLVIVLLTILWAEAVEYTGRNVTIRSTTGHSIVKRTSYADGTGYGCSYKFSRRHCWKYCNGNSGNWCYTVWNYIVPGTCRDDGDCRGASACQGWCAWNSQSGCSKACREETPKPPQQQGGCRHRPWWQCQIRDKYYNRNAGNSNIAGKAIWISPDTEDNLTARGLKGTGNKITAPNNNSAPYTVLWFPMGEIQETRTTFYWDFKISAETEGIWIGVSDLIQAKAGWSTKGLYYGGNLSDGSGLLIEKYGPKPKAGDKVGLLVKLMDSNMKIYFFLNEKPLGLAFDLPQAVLYGIFPVVKFTGKGSVTIEERESNQIPTVIEPPKVTELEGTWTLESFGNKEQLAVPVTLKISKASLRDGFAYRLRLHILSRFMGQLSQTGPNAWRVEINDKPTVSGKPDEMKFELKVLEHLQRVTNMIFNSGKSELGFESGGTASKSTWQQLEPKLTVVRKNPFNE